MTVQTLSDWADSVKDATDEAAIRGAIARKEEVVSRIATIVGDDMWQEVERLLFEFDFLTRFETEVLSHSAESQ